MTRTIQYDDEKWQLVPKWPDQAMWERFMDIYEDIGFDTAWNEVLKVAPTPEEK